MDTKSHVEPGEQLGESIIQQLEEIGEENEDDEGDDVGEGTNNK